MTATPMIEANGVEKYFGTNQVLRGVSINVERSEVLCLVGASGSGKSTFLRCINHLEAIDGGEIRVDGRFIGYEERGNQLHELKERQVCRRRSEIGMVFQTFNLFPHMTVLENIIEGPTWTQRKPRRKAITRAEELLEQVGIPEKIRAYPRQLSGGQQQRVAIARALAMEPKLMLFDEPTSALDPELVGEVLGVMRDLAKSGMTMVVVTHEIAFAQEVGDSLAFMDEGRIVQRGAPRDVIAQPANDRVARFFARIEREEDDK